MSCNHKDNEETRKWSTAVQSSYRLVWKLLLHVESTAGAQQRHRASIPALYSGHNWLRRHSTWPMTFRDDKDESHCAMLIAEWVGQPLYCRWKTKASNRFKVPYAGSCWAFLLSTYVRCDCIRRFRSNFWMLTLNRSTFFLWPIWLFIVANMVFSCGRYGLWPIWYRPQAFSLQ